MALGDIAFSTSATLSSAKVGEIVGVDCLRALNELDRRRMKRLARFPSFNFLSSPDSLHSPVEVGDRGFTGDVAASGPKDVRFELMLSRPMREV
jgi:hypothetical protein